MTSTYLTRLAAALDGAGTDPDTLARIAAGVSRWEPIETAPKDGTKILGYEKGEIFEYIEVMSFSSTLGRPRWQNGGYAYNPSHWMPLLEPPAEETT